ncbi:MAG TPA: undecaprenyl/decaprenyl-phosphate alpha-N-acetylglucosaminyl 1-phosphate transferase [Candidatus Cloacimonetes bacterium]|nr:undecaprenyl/decaprenyl-phosphate alpha-N-acetylglucosaminyl 1-phosphate transferase [Candidatus Cloacimonadota bacterium]
MNHFIIFAISFVSVFLLTFLVRKVAVELNFIDNPEERKFHKTPTPLMGGLAILIGMICAFFLSFFICINLIPQVKSVLSFFVGLVLMCFLGLLDDYQGMTPSVKFSVQFIIAIILIIGSGYTELIGPWFVTVPILVIWMVGLMNALNFLDNMDGITAGLASILGLGFFALGILSGNHFISLISVIFIGATLGFLPHNFHPAKIFLGDAGSMLIGYTLSVLGIVLLTELPKNFSLFLPVLLLSYAIFDISLVSITRRRDGRRVLQGGKDHSTHRIGTATGSVRITAVMVYLINILMVLITVIVYETSSQWAILITTVLFAIVFLFFGGKLDQIPILISRNQLRVRPSHDNTK